VLPGCVRGDLEHRDRALQALGLLFQRGGGGRGLLHHRGVFLRGALDIGDGVIDRGDAGGLLGGGAGDFRHDLSHAIDRGQHVAHGVAGQVDLAHAGLDARGRILDQALDFLGRLGAALGQRAHLSRHHREALALLAGAGGFHRRVQCQDVGLEGDAVHHPHDFTDAARAVGNTLHAGHDLLHGLTAMPGQLGRAERLAAGQVGIAGGHLHRMRQLRHVGRRFLQRAGLARGAVRHVGAAGRDLARARMDLLDAMAHRRHRRRQAGLHAAHGRIQHANLVVAMDGDVAGQVAVGDAVEMRAGLVQRPQDAAAKAQPDQHRQHQHEAQHRGGHHGHALHGLAGAGHRGLALLARIGLIGVGLLHVGRAGCRQHLVDQSIHLDAVPALDGLEHGRQRLVGESGIGRQRLVEQRRALGAGVGIGAQPRQAGGGLLEQRVGVVQRLVAGLFQPALHGGLGIGQRGARLEQAARHVRQVAGALDAAPAQRLDVGAVLAQHMDAGRRRQREQRHEHRENGGNRRRHPEIFPHIHPSVASPPRRIPAIMEMQFGNFLTQPRPPHDERPSHKCAFANRNPVLMNCELAGAAPCGTFDPVPNSISLSTSLPTPCLKPPTPTRTSAKPSATCAPNSPPNTSARSMKNAATPTPSCAP